MNNNDKEDRDTLTIRMGNVNTHSHLGEFSPIMERIDQEPRRNRKLEQLFVNLE